MADAIYAWHLYYIDALAVRFRATDQHYFLHDANFNVTAAYDVNPSSGTYRQVVERYSYTPYGEVTFLNPDFSVKVSQTSAIGNNYLYTGRERDPETGLYNFRTRIYHAGLGRFTSQDWIRYHGGMNLYGYVGGMPTRFVDPFGLQPPLITPPIFSDPNPPPDAGGMPGVPWGELPPSLFWPPQTTPRPIVEVQPIGSGLGLGSALAGEGPTETLGGFVVREFFDTLFPPVQQSHRYTFDDGSSTVVLNGSPSSGGLAGQALFGAPFLPKGMPKKPCPPKPPCFPPGTPVLMADRSTKNIEDVEPGDMVLADDPEDQEQPAAYKVLAVPKNWTEWLIHIDIDKDGDGESDGHYRATGKHRIWTVGRGWQHAVDLEIGDELLTDGLEKVRVIAVAEENIVIDTYNLSVEGVHTFYVVDNGVAVLVHNTDVWPKVGSAPQYPPPPNFLVDPGGQVFPVPPGATGPTPVINPGGTQTGWAFTGGHGGANGQVTTIRIMDPTLPRGADPGHAHGYIKYENSAKPKPQPVDPYTGRTIPNTQAHYEIKPKPPACP